MKTIQTLAATAIFVSGLACAQMSSMQIGANAAASTPTATTKLTDGEVRKVDGQQGRITLRHGPIENLGMPGMTMTFKVADPKSLGDFKESDKVRFRAERIDGAVAVTHIEAAK